jgi:hypothetical protein
VSARRPALALGCGAALMACLACPFAPYLWRTGSLRLAQQRWAQNGGATYTLVVSLMCYCPAAGDFRIAVQNNRLIAATPIFGKSDPITYPPALRMLEPLTVNAMLAEAAQATARSWLVPWNHQLNVEFDPAYGYVTRYAANDNSLLALRTGYGYIPGTAFSYTARDLQLPGQ